MKRKINLPSLKFLFVLIVILCFYSCRKAPIAELDTIVLGKVYSYYNHPNIQNTSGQILFQVKNVANDPSTKNAALIYGGFDNINNSLTGYGGIVNIAGYNLINNTRQGQITNNIGYDSLYGKVISYNIKPPIGEGITPITGSFYSPAPIYATNIPAMTHANIPQDSTFPITWAADANNTNEVNIEADYYPTGPNNWDLAAKGDSLYLQNSIMVPDNGSTQLPASFFSKFPIGATLWVFIGRGNAVYIQSGQYIYLINGFFRSAFYAVKK